MQGATVDPRASLLRRPRGNLPVLHSDKSCPKIQNGKLSDLETPTICCHFCMSDWLYLRFYFPYKFRMLSGPPAVDLICVFIVLDCGLSNSSNSMSSSEPLVGRTGGEKNVGSRCCQPTWNPLKTNHRPSWPLLIECSLQYFPEELQRQSGISTCFCFQVVHVEVCSRIKTQEMAFYIVP